MFDNFATNGNGPYYVYICYVENAIRYVGMGKGNRYKHCVSGKSSCSELNKDFHAGKNMRVEIFKDSLTENDARLLEAYLVEQNIEGLYNKVVHQTKRSVPSSKRIKDLKLLYSNWATGEDEVKFEKFVLDRGISCESRNYLEMVDILTQAGLAIYVAELPSKAKILVIDKLSDSEVDNWMDRSFKHLAHPDGLYGAGVGIDLELGKY